VQLAGLGKLKKFNDQIRNQNRNLLACLPQPSTLLRAPAYAILENTIDIAYVVQITHWDASKND
jgi:hypothetical protein